MCKVTGRTEGISHPRHAERALWVDAVDGVALGVELELAARDAGAHAELEVPGPNGAWRADVLATDSAGDWKAALEAQLASITGADIAVRTEKMRRRHLDLGQ
ncbi:hypothetical protein AB0G64_22840 [Streptomyces longwoodensis]|uniref:hypothetical protein n=1 Tax=Streptomyces longwoodensis TaxID=68231 RepID=UPI0033E7242E